uniref:Uncharacterized protein LOC104233857 n=1 Tax=Nicotiana sylvestris TaxID=4096 RepID=A0A1U7X7E4_NICSY|nr:PREDICTED: uncharacterized protein LOC104233857 [Nicotiana sylvestris]
MGELNVFLGLQEKLSIKGTYINQKCIKELLKSKPDIVFSVGLHARFQSNPEESHLKAAKRVLRYFKGRQNLVLYYTSSDNFNLIGYANTDYAGYLVDRKGTSEWLISLNYSPLLLRLMSMCCKPYFSSVPETQPNSLLAETNQVVVKKKEAFDSALQKSKQSIKKKEEEVDEIGGSCG